MKRFLCLILCAVTVCLVFSAAALPAFGVELDENHAYDTLGTVQSCRYKSEEKRLEISGTLLHETLIEYKNYKIGLYRIPFGVDAEQAVAQDEAELVAQSAISLHFSFGIHMKSVEELMQQYVVALYRNDDVIFVSSPKSPSIASSYSYDDRDRSDFKGFITDVPSVSLNSSAASTVIPVYLDELVNDTAIGHLYSLDKQHVYFDKDAVSALDAKIKLYSGTGTRVYLRLMLREEVADTIDVYGGAPDTTQFFMPCVDDETTRLVLYAVADFLSTRYAQFEHGAVDGYILGKTVDDMKQHYAVAQDTASYADKLFSYAHAISLGVLSNTPEADIVLPVSDGNDYVSDTPIGGEYHIKQLLSSFFKITDSRYTETAKISLMLESESLPFDMTDASLQGGIHPSLSQKRITAETLAYFSLFFDELTRDYDTVAESYMYVCHVPSGVSADVLGTSYVYSYGKLLGDTSVRSFLLDVSHAEEEIEAFALGLLNDVDTDLDMKSFDRYLSYFGKESWQEVWGEDISDTMPQRKLYGAELLDKIPHTVVGSYAYFDFSYVTDLTGWSISDPNGTLRVDYDETLEKALIANFSHAPDSTVEYSEMLCRFDLPENYVYTPYIGVRMMVRDSIRDAQSLYEVKIAMGRDNAYMECSQILQGNEEGLVALNIADFVEASMTDYIRISVRPLHPTDEGYSVVLSSIQGYSDQYVSEELENLISQERLRIRNLQEEDTSSVSKGKITMIVLGVVILIAVIAIGIFMCFRKEDTEDSSRMNE